jgi:hypothetical protein
MVIIGLLIFIGPLIFTSFFFWLIDKELRQGGRLFLTCTALGAFLVAATSIGNLFNQLLPCELSQPKGQHCMIISVPLGTVAQQ